ncbi:hypothetical protein GLOIN_2v1477844 [Rhizophagus clarus]|uniref:Peptidase S1 domain-containing protein n=1 Tax=Rhizophagus clarus TaxID=94130 RepID=A0A8H3LAQ7_9GLOM|nr:hypothetical protein GLOIN_2v1477844 [Rhizophagus clarus]
MSRKKTAISVIAYQDNAIKKYSTEDHTEIKELLSEELKKIPGWNISKYPGKNLSKNVYAYVKRHHKCITNTNYLEKGEEKGARKTIREYLYRYLPEKESVDSDFETTAVKAETTTDMRYEELGTLISVDEGEIDEMILFNLTKDKVNNPVLINSISTNLDDIVEQIKKIGQELSVESYMHFYITGLQRLNFVLKSAVPMVGNRKVSQVFDDDIYIKIGKASRELRKEFGNKVPFSLIYPGMVDEKACIIAAVNLKDGTPVYNIPAEFKGFPVLINYGTIKPSSYDYYRKYQNLKPGISIDDAEIDGVCTLGTLFRAKNQTNKKYLLTVQHGVGDTGGSVIQPGKVDNGKSENQCAIVSYQTLCIDKFNRLLDYAFCEVDHCCDGLINVHKTGRTTGHTTGKMFTNLQPGIVTNLFDEEKTVDVLIVTGDNGDFDDSGDSGSPVYDQDGGLWGIYEGTFIKGGVSVVIPIDIILQSVYDNTKIEFKLLKMSE